MVTKKKNELRFCCSRFRIEWSVRGTLGFNIRVVKFEPEDFRFLIEGNQLFRFYITAGYKVGEKPNPYIVIAYCPFCGQSLYDYYNSKEYVNEDKNIFIL